MVGKFYHVSINVDGGKSEVDHRRLRCIDIPDLSYVVVHARQLGDDFYGAITDIDTGSEGDYYRLFNHAGVGSIG